MNYFRTIVFITLITIITISCESCKSGSYKGPSKECIKFNDDGINILSSYPNMGKNSLDTAIYLFKKALGCDSNNVIFYINLATAYDKKHSYELEMNVLNKTLTLTANDPAILLQKGMLFERVGRPNDAGKIYKSARSAYAQRLAKRPLDLKLIKGMILLKAVAESKDEAVKEINRQIVEHPELSSALSDELLFFNYFNRHAFVFGLPSEKDLIK